jgi:shikimate kinase
VIHRPEIRIALTGFMGVGKSSVARHLAHLLDCRRIDLDSEIEDYLGESIASVIDRVGIEEFRRVETDRLKNALADGTGGILSLGGGTWTLSHNRDLIKQHGYKSVWLESSFEHCWFNIRHSRKERPLARSKAAAKKLFDERQSLYCLADLHFIVRPEFSSYEIAHQIIEQIS